MANIVKISTDLWVWRDKWEIRRPGPSDIGGRGLGYPRGRASVGQLEAYQALADWLCELGASCICGPVLSGAQMAYAVALVSGDRIDPIYLPKDGYRPSKHYSSSDIYGPYAMIDDIVASGEGMGTDKAVRHAGGRKPLAIIADQWALSALQSGPLSDFADLAWTVAPHK